MGIELSGHLSLWELIQFVGPKILMALLCGGIVGLERELRRKSAGIKTNMLICVGSALYTALSCLISASFADQGVYGDPGRVAAQIVSGIGFLGGGAIIQSKGNIHGLTTAATIWVVAALGVSIGIGYGVLALCSAFIVVMVLIGVRWIENRFLSRTSSYSCEIVVRDSTGKTKEQLQNLIFLNDLDMDDFDLFRHNGDSQIRMRVKGSLYNYKQFQLALWKLKGVREIRQTEG